MNFQFSWPRDSISILWSTSLSKLIWQLSLKNAMKVLWALPTLIHTKILWRNNFSTHSKWENKNLSLICRLRSNNQVAHISRLKALMTMTPYWLWKQHIRGLKIRTRKRNREIRVWFNIKCLILKRQSYHSLLWFVHQATRHAVNNLPIPRFPQ